MARTTKGRRERVLPLHPRFREALEMMSRNPDGKVFHGACGGMLKPDKVRKALIRDVLTPLAERFPRTPGEPAFTDGRLHSFRHYFCSMCADRGVPEQMLMNWLGHRDSDMVKRYYHASRDEAQRMMRQIQFADGPAPVNDGSAEPAEAETSVGQSN